MQSNNESNDSMSDGHKCRIISFRLSDHEYGTVEAACRKHGFKSISLFARSAILTCNGSEPTHSPVDVDINRLWRRLEVMTIALETLIAQVGLECPRAGRTDGGYS